MTDDTGGRSPLHGCAILLIEDNMLIALDSQDTLMDAGATRVYPVATPAEARNVVVARQQIDAAVLDLHLGDENGLPIAEILTLAAIPFIFSTGLSGDSVIPPSMSGIPMLRKPYTPQELVTAVESVLGRRKE